MSRKLSSESITVRPTLKVFKALSPGLYNSLIALPDNVRSEYILEMLKWASVNMESPAPAHSASDGSVRVPLPSSPYGATPPDASDTTTSNRARTATPLTSAHPEIHAATNVAAEKSRRKEAVVEEAGLLDSPRGLEVLGFSTLADLGDVFDYSTPPSPRSGT